VVVVVSVDQLTYEYLDRFRHNFSERGFFGRCMKEGAWFSECHHRHSFTLTGPGHSVMMTGTYPYATGIIDNNWYDRGTKKSVYCVADPSYPIIGTSAGKAELKGVSPKNLLVSTVGDSLKRATGGKAKVYGITLKDRAAVLMAGHSADMAIWFDPSAGMWVSSRYYRNELPKWLKEVNASRSVDAYVGTSWNLLHGDDKYKLYYPDDSPFEGNPEKLGRAFPHKMSDKANAQYYKQLPITPFGNELTIEVAKQLIENEKIGQDEIPDILCVGCSANDYVGHNYGPHSLEVEDMVYRTDILLGEFADYLDKKVGSGKWMMALTADHAVAPIPEYSATQGLGGKRNALDPAKLRKTVESALVKKFGALKDKETYVEKFEAHQVYLRRAGKGADKKTFSEMQRITRDVVAADPAVEVVFTRDELLASPPKEYSLINQFRRTCNPERSGDVLYAQKPYLIVGSLTATHGSPWRYDTNVPLLFLGASIEPGQHDRQVSPAMIAPTVAKLLKIAPPTGNQETALDEVLKK
jgi:predicted AlkP superfamily pyrophosphatase or phosphodiesterase